MKVLIRLNEKAFSDHTSNEACCCDRHLNAKQLSKSPFIPDNVQDEFNKLSTEHKSKFCGFENYKIRKGIINKDLAIRILGYNSRMDNWKIVEGVHSRDVFKEYADVVTYASVSENDQDKRVSL